MLLYINGNYPHHSLHRELVAGLADLGNEIAVFVPMNGTECENRYSCDSPGVTMVYRDCLSLSDKVFFFQKIRKIVREIEKTVDMGKVDCILAGTVYSDGYAAYLLHKKYHIPFSVAVRQTDVAYQMKWRPYLNGFIRRLLEQTTRIVFLTPAYLGCFDKIGSFQDKSVIIPNAVNDYWFEVQTTTRQKHKPLSLIYVGELSANKNVKTTIRAVAELKKRGVPAELHIVGSGKEEDECRVLAGECGISERIFFHGWQNEKEKIKAFYDQSDIFVMPSFRETFGTVYIEALSQGIPVIYTRGQGIDGFFNQGTVGFSCEPTDINAIATAISVISEQYEFMSAECVAASKRFQWKTVAEQYNEVIDIMRNR